MPGLRRWIQVAATLLSNGYWLFPWGESLYRGPLKTVCLPGLNCYSCPAATGACPLGALQHFLAELRPGFAAGQPRPGLYVAGLLGFSGSLVGRMPCAWLCPFGLLQEWLHRIPSPKLPVPRVLSWLKYLFLALFVIVLPLWAVDEFGYGMTWFCKFICPAGTLEAGIPLLILEPELRSLVGWLFYAKLSILALFLAWMVVSRRPFCRTACPLGAIYSLFNKHSAFRLVHHPDRCTHCRACFNDCPMGVKVYEGANQLDCIRCLRCLRRSCRFEAISFEVAGMGPGVCKTGETAGVAS
jgi:polyferredoxin